MESSAIRSHWPLSILSSVSSLITMLLPLLLVRLLPPSEIGAFKVFFLYLMLCPQLSLASGVINGISYWAPRSQGGRSALALSALIIGILALLSAFACWLATPLFEGWLGFSESEALLFALAVFVTIPNSIFEELSISLGSVWRGALVSAGFDLLRSLLMAGAALWSGTLDAVLLAYVVALGAKSLIGALWSIQAGYIKAKIDLRGIGAVLRYAFPVALAGILGIVVGYADQLLLTAALSRSDFAIYAIGCLSIPPLFAIEYSIVRILIPQLGRSFVSGSEQAVRLYRHAVQELSFMMVPATVGLIAFADPIISLLFTDRYGAAANYLKIFAISYILLIIPYDAVARARGNSTWILKTFALFSALALICAAVGLQLGSAFGALIGVLLARTLMKFYALAHISRSESWRLSEILPLNSIFRYLTLALVLWALAVALKPLFSSAILWLLVCGPLFGLLYLLGVCLWKEAAPKSFPARVLLLTQCLRIGGLEKMVLSLCLGLKRQGKWDISVFSYDQGESIAACDLLPEFKRNGVELEHFEKPEGFSLAVVFKLVQYISERGIRVIHSHDLGGLIYGALAKLFAPYRVRLVHTQHSFVHLNSDHRRYTIYEIIFSRLVDELVVVSEETKQGYVRLGLNPKRIHIVENGVSICEEPIVTRSARLIERAKLISSIEASPVQARILAEQDTIWLIQMARLHPVKGQRHLLKLWRELPKETRQKCLLLIVGPEAEDGELAVLTDALKSLPDRDRVILFGGTNNPQQWLRASDIYISCSESEGLPLGPLEAISAGLPCMLSEISGHAFLNSVSVQYSLARPDIGAARLLTLIAEAVNPEAEFRDKLLLAARWVMANFSLEEMTRRYSDLYLHRATRESANAWIANKTAEATT